AALVPPVALFSIATVVLMDAPIPVMCGLLFVNGLGMGATTNAGLTLVRELVQDDELGRATAAHQFIRNLGFALGNALVGAVLLYVVARITGNVEQIREVLGRAAGTHLAPEVANAIQKGFGIGGLCAATVATISYIPLRLVAAKVSD
ncbi:MAG: hypothetical protein KC561_20165, partial [Myxococcales bacterium]|nr:hypothetical protein [Myxococcales bacterium]